MRNVAAFSVVVGFAGFSGSVLPALAGGDVNVYSYRQPELIQPALDAFTKKTGITANVLFLDKGLIERMKTEGENSPADLVITTDVGRLDELKQAGVTQALHDSDLDNEIPAKFRDPDGQWFGLGMDARVVYAAKDRVRQTAISYDDLLKPEWKGKICLRDGQYASNLGLFADMISARGAAATETWLTGLKANLAARPSGNDASQIQSIAEGKCDLALGYASVVAAMTATTAKEDMAQVEKIRVILPEDAKRGTYVNISGMVLALHAPNRDNAVKLMQFLASAEGQSLYAAGTLEYPIAASASPGKIIASFGTLTPDAVPLSDVLKYRDQASALVDKVGFNDGPGE